jgi:hypothetical protein
MTKTTRFRGELPAARLGLPCRLELGALSEFPEPPVRVNTDILDASALGWSEAQAWDVLVSYYTRPETR